MGKAYLPATIRQFWSACDKSKDCWFYNYKFFTHFQGRSILAHRLAWELYHKKPLPSKFTLVLHSCGEAKCVNPKHLYLGTSKDVEGRNSSPEKFWARVNKNGPVVRKGLGKCWLWTGPVYNHGGYGQVQYQKKAYGAHRLAWRLTFGEAPEDKLVCHHCDNPLCVRPSHLFLGTPKDNTQDMVQKGRYRGRPVGSVTSLETRAKISAALKGRQPRLGAVLSAETKEKIRQAQLRFQAAKRNALS